MRSLTSLERVGIHVGVWASFIIYEVYVSRSIYNTVPLYYFAGFYLIDFWLFYFNAHFACPIALRTKKPGLILALIIPAELGLYDLMSVGMDIAVHSIEKGHLDININMQDWTTSTWRAVYFLGLSTGYFFGLTSVANARKATKILEQKLESERREAAMKNAYIRAQINPHLLFNTLTFISNSVEGDTEETILLLAESMEYALMPADQDGKVELYIEIEQIERFIQLHQLSAKNKPHIILNITPENYDRQLRIPPLLLITFVENIYKHGNLVDGPATITIQLISGVLHFYTENLKDNKERHYSPNIGLTNSRLRLQRYYEGNFQLDIDSMGNNFIIDLKLKL